MSDDCDTDAWIDAMAPVVGLTVTDEQRPGVRTFLEIAKGMAVRLERVELPDDKLEPAPVFTPTGPS
ncbi:MAG: DUF4089 domain-containing protein [Alphaproteobacteria bacterium]